MDHARALGFVALAVVPVTWSVACSGTPHHPPLEDPTIPGGGGSSGYVTHSYDSGISDVAEDTAGQCNNLPGSAVQVDVEFVGPTGAPSPAGGTPTDGTYAMSAYKVYGTTPNGGTGKPGNWFKEVFRLTGPMFEVTSESDQAARLRSSGTWAVPDAGQPTSFQIKLSCPRSSSEAFGFTASSSSISLFPPGPGGATAVATYDRTQ
jgi:hypothetical protein